MVTAGLTLPSLYSFQIATAAGTDVVLDTVGLAGATPHTLADFTTLSKEILALG